MTLHAPLSSDGEPIGDVSGDLDLYLSPDHRFARLTVLGPRVIVRLDNAASSFDTGAVNTHARPVIDLGWVKPDHFELCFDKAVLPIVLRKIKKRPTSLTTTPLSIAVYNKPFIVDRIELCIADGDIGSSFVLYVMHWTAPDGTRISLEGSANNQTHLRFRSDPSRPESAIMALLLFDP